MNESNVEFNPDDQELVERFQSGQVEAFDLIVERYLNEVSRLVHHFLESESEMEDCTQEVFVTVWKKLNGFKKQSSLKTWLFAITVRQCKNVNRSWIRRARRFWNMGNDFPSDRVMQNLEDEPCQDFRSELIRSTVDRLPEKLKDVIVLYYLEDCPISEVSSILAIKENAVEVRLHRARKILKETMTSSEEWKELGVVRSS